MVQLPNLRASFPQKRDHLFCVSPTRFRFDRITARRSICPFLLLGLINTTAVEPRHVHRRVDSPF